MSGEDGVREDFRGTVWGACVCCHLPVEQGVLVKAFYGGRWASAVTCFACVDTPGVIDALAIGLARRVGLEFDELRAETSEVKPG